MDYIILIMAIVYGILSGIMTGVLGYLKTVAGLLKAGQTAEALDYQKMAQTIVLGGIIGAFAGYSGLPWDQAQTMFWIMIQNMGLTAVFDWALKIVSRALGKWMQDHDRQEKPKKKKKKKVEEKEKESKEEKPLEEKKEEPQKELGEVEKLVEECNKLEEEIKSKRSKKKSKKE
jgi:folate-dependent tRNA-U54 methylase TrmFO/GidA